MDTTNDDMYRDLCLIQIETDQRNKNISSRGKELIEKLRNKYIEKTDTERKVWRECLKKWQEKVNLNETLNKMNEYFKEIDEEGAWGGGNQDDEEGTLGGGNQDDGQLPRMKILLTEKEQSCLKRYTRNGPKPKVEQTSARRTYNAKLATPAPMTQPDNDPERDRFWEDDTNTTVHFGRKSRKKRKM